MREIDRVSEDRSFNERIDRISEDRPSRQRIDRLSERIDRITEDRSITIKKCASRPLKIEKLMRAWGFIFYFFYRATLAFLRRE